MKSRRAALSVFAEKKPTRAALRREQFMHAAPMSCHNLRGGAQRNARSSTSAKGVGGEYVKKSPRRVLPSRRECHGPSRWHLRKIECRYRPAALCQPGGFQAWPQPGISVAGRPTVASAKLRNAAGAPSAAQGWCPRRNACPRKRVVPGAGDRVCRSSFLSNACRVRASVGVSGSA